MNIKYLFFMMTIILNISPLLGQDLLQESYNRYTGTSTYTFEVEGQGQLEMNKIRGDVYIQGEPTNQIQIHEKITIRATSEGKAREIYNDVKATITSTKDELGNTAVSVRGKTGKRWRPISSEYTITLPTLFSLLVDTRGGDIEVENVQGEIQLSTSGGDLSLSDLSGRISASTSGGDIDSEKINGRIFLNTSGGDIEIINSEGQLNAKTSGGDIDVQNIRGDVSVNTSGGDITIEDVEGREITARTSGGDITAENIIGETDLTTSGGDIDLDYIQGDIEASTSGGDIDMEEMRGSVRVWTSAGYIEGKEISGSIDARTTAGDIVISKTWDHEIEDHDIDLKTSAGDIELVLPPDFPGDFIIRVSSPLGRTSDAIQSDFPLYITATENSAKAKGKVGNGLFRVNVQTSMGQIVIKQED